MHPNRAFSVEDRQTLLNFIAERAFAHIFAVGDDGLAVVHAPLIVVDGKIQFHFSRRNRAVDAIAGNRVLISVAGRDAYHSANWYRSADQVPTWLYEVVEIEGEARQLTEAELIAQLDRLSEIMEERHSPEEPWTRAKMTPGKFEAMVKAIVGFEVDPVKMRGTFKFNQHKPADDVDATIAGQSGVGRQDIVAAIRSASGRP